MRSMHLHDANHVFCGVCLLLRSVCLESLALTPWLPNCVLHFFFQFLGTCYLGAVNERPSMLRGRICARVFS